MNAPTQFRDPELKTDGSVIGFYEREFYVFSNFSSFAVRWRGKEYPTSEHAYQAAKFIDTIPNLAETIRLRRSAHDAAKQADFMRDSVPSDWPERKVSVMEEICRAKLEQHEYVRRKLLQTGDLEMVEDSPKDAFWGIGPNGDGRNELGKVWMRLRSELRRR